MDETDQFRGNPIMGEKIAYEFRRTIDVYRGIGRKVRRVEFSYTAWLHLLAYYGWDPATTPSESHDPVTGVFIHWVPSRTLPYDHHVVVEP